MAESAFECLLNYMTYSYYCVIMQAPFETTGFTSKVHVKSTSEVRERAVSANVLLETADLRALPRPVAVGERMCAQRRPARCASRQ